MESWYEVQVKFTKEFSDGTLKRVTEPYLVSVMSFSEAEERIYKEVGEFTRGEFMVKSIKKVDFMDIFHYDDAETWFSAKISYISEDADSGREKKIKNNYLVIAHTTEEANERIKDSMSGLLVRYEITEIKKTKIVEIFPYESTGNSKEE